MIKWLSVRENKWSIDLHYCMQSLKKNVGHSIYQCFLLNTALSKSSVYILYIYVCTLYSVVDIFLVLLLLLYTLVFIVHLFMFILLSFYLLTKKSRVFYFVKYFFLEYSFSLFVFFKYIV